MSWGVFMGLGQGLSDYSKVLGEHKEMAWKQHMADIQYQREKTLKELELNTRKEISRLDRESADKRARESNENYLKAVEQQGLNQMAYLEEKNRLDQLNVQRLLDQERLDKGQKIAAIRTYFGEDDPIGELMALSVRTGQDLTSLIPKARNLAAADVEAINTMMMSEAYEKEFEKDPMGLWTRLANEYMNSTGSGGGYSIFDRTQGSDGIPQKFEITDPRDLQEFVDKLLKHDPETLKEFENELGPITKEKVKKMVLEQTDQFVEGSGNKSKSKKSIIGSAKIYDVDPKWRDWFDRNFGFKNTPAGQFNKNSK